MALRLANEHESGRVATEMAIIVVVGEEKKVRKFTGIMREVPPPAKDFEKTPSIALSAAA
jgi:hypothetical protein